MPFRSERATGATRWLTSKVVLHFLRCAAWTLQILLLRFRIVVFANNQNAPNLSMCAAALKTKGVKCFTVNPAQVDTSMTKCAQLTLLCCCLLLPPPCQALMLPDVQCIGDLLPKQLPLSWHLSIVLSHNIWVACECVHVSSGAAFDIWHCKYLGVF